MGALQTRALTSLLQLDGLGLGDALDNNQALHGGERHSLDCHEPSGLQLVKVFGVDALGLAG